MLELPRLTMQRQRRVYLALLDLLADKIATKPMHADVRASLAKTVDLGAGLSVDRELPPLVLDNTADAVIGAFDDLLESVERLLNDRVVRPLTEEQTQMKNAATTVRQFAFAEGTDYLVASMPLQYKGMRATADALQNNKTCAAAVKTLHLGWAVDHLIAHLAPYGRAVKAADGRDLEAVSDAFHAALEDLAVKTTAHHGADKAIRSQLLGAYETELAAQREDERATRKRSADRRRANAPK